MANEKETPVSPTPISSNRLPVEVQKAPTTLDELGNLMRDGFKSQMRVQNETNRSIKKLENDFKTELHALTVRLEKVESHAFGETQLSSLPPTSSLAERVTDHEKEIPSIQGRLMAVESVVKTVQDINRAQSRAMGLARPGASPFERAWKFLWSRQGMTSVAALIAAITGLIAALKK